MIKRRRLEIIMAKAVESCGMHFCCLNRALPFVCAKFDVVNFEIVIFCYRTIIDAQNDNLFEA